jgi:membrane protein DedA with SNARE-associated domain
VNLFGHNLLTLMASHGYLLLFVILLLEESGVPVPLPGDLLLLFTGSLVAQGTLSLAPIFLILIAAILIGSSILYTIAVRGGRPLLRRRGRWLRLKEERIDRAERWLEARPIRGVAMLRLTPGLRIYSTIVAGLLAVPRARATISFVVSGVIWATAWLSLGIVLDTNVNRAAVVVSRIERLIVPLFIAALVGLAMFWIGRHVYRRYASDGTAPRELVSRLVLHRIGTATASAIALLLLLVTPPLLGTFPTISERTGHGHAVERVVGESLSVRLIHER